MPSQTEPVAVEAASASAPTKHPIVGGIDIGIGLGLLFAIWGLLPARWWPVDVLGSVLAVALLVAGAALCLGLPWARRAGVVTSMVTLAAGTGLSTALAFTASYLSGLYGPVGKGGALILVVVAALVVPYLVALPTAQLYWMLKGKRA